MVAAVIGSLAAGYNRVACKVRRELVLFWYPPFTGILLLQGDDSTGSWFAPCFVMCVPVELEDKPEIEFSGLMWMK